jgi:hypothetical protein
MPLQSAVVITEIGDLVSTDEDAMRRSDMLTVERGLQQHGVTQIVFQAFQHWGAYTQVSWKAQTTE